MEIRDWEKRYRLREHAISDFEAGPTPLLMQAVSALPPGKALDLASGAGRNALWLAEHGWTVTAVDGATSEIESVRSRASERGVNVRGVIADLEKDEFEIEPAAWDLVAILYYLQRNLFEPAKRGVVPGGILISIVHLNEPEEADGPFRLRPGQHEQYFSGWEILHLREGKAIDPAHRRAVSEIVAHAPK
jgi:SAM-dependent methyltransferase